MTAAAELVERIWYGESAWRWLLAPMSLLFAAVSRVRHCLYRTGIRRAIDVGRPVIVVGNITAGGTGKTPIALWIAEQLKERGRRPGIVSRGYGGRSSGAPVRVAADSDPSQVGDEPLLMERRRICPVVVHPDRVAAARVLIDLDCDVIVADDGLQHYRLARQYEIAVLDGDRNFGNGFLLPAGPLRELPARLGKVDYVMVQQGNREARSTTAGLPDAVPCAYFELRVAVVRNLADARKSTVAAFRGRTVHAVAGIGHPARFFRLLEGHGINVIPHPYADHAVLTERDLRFDDDLEVLMTEKDAVRCASFATKKCWYVAVDVAFASDGPAGWLDGICKTMDRKEAKKPS